MAQTGGIDNQEQRNTRVDSLQTGLIIDRVAAVSAFLEKIAARQESVKAGHSLRVSIRVHTWPQFGRASGCAAENSTAFSCGTFASTRGRVYCLMELWQRLRTQWGKGQLFQSRNGCWIEGRQTLQWR
ncbi:hypothetical protein C8R43DRAFT_958871 [Mycena crocata]|nr:hypothetical protein C8R43DRAFT_958871 [Mycena crocata]